MKTAIVIGALAVFAAAATSVPAAAASGQTPPAQGHALQGQTLDLSAAKRHYRHTRHYRHYGYRWRGPFGAYAADPSIGYFPSLRRAQSLGRCVEDLGYGAFAYCD